MGYKVMTVKKWKKGYTTNGNPIYSFTLQTTSGDLITGKTKPNSDVNKLSRVEIGDEINAELYRTPGGRVYMSDGEPVARQNPSPRAIHVKRKTQARTQATAEGYVNRPSQITKKKPSKRLVNRRIRNLQVPVGVFPNPKKRDPTYWVIIKHDGYLSFRSNSGYTGSTPYDALPGSTISQKVNAFIKQLGIKRGQYEILDENPAPRYPGAMDVGYPSLAAFSKDAKACGYDPDELLETGEYFVESDGHVLAASLAGAGRAKKNPAPKKSGRLKWQIGSVGKDGFEYGLDEVTPISWKVVHSREIMKAVYSFGLPDPAPHETAYAEWLEKINHSKSGDTIYGSVRDLRKFIMKLRGPYKATVR